MRGPILISKGTLGDCIREFMSRPAQTPTFRETTSYLPLSDRLMRVTMSSQACSSLVG